MSAIAIHPVTVPARHRSASRLRCRHGATAAGDLARALVHGGVVLVLAVALGWYLAAARATASGAAEAAPERAATAGASSSVVGARVVVDEGDTLWHLALEHAPPGADVLGYAATVAEANGVRASSLRPGSVLVMP